MYRIEMAFGHTDRNGAPLPSDRIARAEELAIRAFSLQFRGAQIYRHPGGYYDDDKRVILEASTTVWAYSADSEPLVAQLSDAAREIAAMLHQQSVLLVILALRGHMYWVRLETATGLDKKRRQLAA